MAASMNQVLFCLSWIIFCISVPFTRGDDEYEGLTKLTLEHTFDDAFDAEYVKRGTLTVKSLRSGGAYYQPENLVSDGDREQLDILVSKNGIYRIRIPTRVVNGKQLYVSTFIPACSLYESKMSDILTLNVDQAGSLLGISMTTTSPYCHGIGVYETDLYRFNTTVLVVQSVSGPSPDTQSYIQQMEQQKAEREKGQQQDNRSFLAKYWMYLIPLVIFLMIASNSQEQGGQ